MHQGIKDHTCPKCEKKFRSSSNRNRHLKFVHWEVQARIMNCKKCQKKFRSERILQQHEKQGSCQAVEKVELALDVQTVSADVKENIHKIEGGEFNFDRTNCNASFQNSRDWLLYGNFHDKQPPHDSVELQADIVNDHCNEYSRILDQNDQQSESEIDSIGEYDLIALENGDFDCLAEMETWSGRATEHMQNWIN